MQRVRTSENMHVRTLLHLAENNNKSAQYKIELRTRAMTECRGLATGVPSLVLEICSKSFKIHLVNTRVVQRANDQSKSSDIISA